MENQNILRIVLSLAIIAAFFLPLYNDSITGAASMSAWQLISNSFGSSAGAANLPASQLVVVICLAVILISIIIIFVFSVVRKTTSVLVNLLPLLSIIALIIFSMTQSDENMGQALQAFGSGFYIMFLSSFLLPFTSIAVPTAANQ